MQLEQIKLSIAEAKRFIAAAEKCVEARSETHTVGEYTFHSSAPLASGALRRASMDLTRQLAEMRKP